MSLIFAYLIIGLVFFLGARLETKWEWSLEEAIGWTLVFVVTVYLWPLLVKEWFRKEDRTEPSSEEKWI